MGGDAVDAADVVHENHREALALLAEQLPGGDTAEFGTVTAATAGVPEALFNRVFVFEEPTAGDLDDAVRWMLDQGEPFWVTVADSVHEAAQDIATNRDLRSLDIALPGMQYAPLTGLPDPQTDLQLERVTDGSGLDEFAEIAADAFGWPVDIATQIVDTRMLDVDALEFVVGRVDGDGVACGQLVRTGAIAGVYTIGVLEEYRRRGYGAAVTWAVIRLGRDAGCTQATLQSSPMGRPVYERMGFETVTTYHQFAPASQAQD